MGAVLSARHEGPADLLDDAVQLIVKDIEQALSEDQHQAAWPEAERNAGLSLFPDCASLPPGYAC
jgi:hypothetical protein